MKKKTQNDYLFRVNNDNDLKPEHYIRKYYKLIKTQINKNTLHLAGPFILSKYCPIYDFILNRQANDNTNTLNTPQLFPKQR